MRKRSFPPGCKVNMYREEEKDLGGYSDEPLIKGPRPCEIKSIYRRPPYGDLCIELVGGYKSYMSLNDCEGPEYDIHGSLADSRDTVDCTIEDYIKAFFKREDREEFFNGFWSGEYYYCLHLETGYCKILEGTEACFGTFKKTKEES